MKRLVAGAVASMLLVLLNPSAGTAGPLNEVTMVGLKYLPPVSVVEPGESIVWRNAEPTDLLPHNVVRLAYIPPGGTPVITTQLICASIDPGRSCTKPAGSLAPGTYVYTCTVNSLHTASMQGLLIVR